MGKWKGNLFFFFFSTTGLNWEFSFSKTGRLAKTKELSLSYYLPIAAGEDMDLCLSRELARSEMQTASSRIWTRIACSISYHDNRCNFFCNKKFPLFTNILFFFSTVKTIFIVTFIW